MENQLPSTRYTSTARWLHWLVAGMIVVQYILAELAEQAGDQNSTLQQLALLAQHKSVGITILGIAVIRLLWRWRHPTPELPEEMAHWQGQAAKVAHWLLYLLLLLVPMTGWLMSSASAYSVSWFNLIALPDLVGADEVLKAQLMNWHEILAKVLFAVAVIHILAAIKHAILDRDQVLNRMLSWPAIGAAVALAAGLVTLSNTETDLPQGSSEASLEQSVSDEQVHD